MWRQSLCRDRPRVETWQPASAVSRPRVLPQNLKYFQLFHFLFALIIIKEKNTAVTLATNLLFTSNQIKIQKSTIRGDLEVLE